MQELEEEESSCFDDLADEIINTILSPPASSIQLLRTWLLELFVRGTVSTDLTKLKRLEALTSPLDRKQLHLIRGRFGDKNFFRKYKTAFGQLAPIEQACFIWGASCLPKDEYDSWLSTIRPMHTSPTGSLFLDWAKSQRAGLITKLDSATIDQE